MSNSIAQNLIKLSTDKTNIQTALVNKGVSVASTHGFDDFATDITSITNTYTNDDEGKVVSDGALVAQTSTTATVNGTIDTTTNNEVVVNVPNSYTQVDEGKVVSNGALINQIAYPTTITENGTYDTTTNNSVTVESGDGNCLKMPSMGVCKPCMKKTAVNKIWDTKIWSGMSSFDGNMVWTNGDDIYYSSSSTQKVLNKSTSTWSNKTWKGMSSFNGNMVWTDGENIYYSSSSTQKVLNKSTSTWSNKTWSGMSSFDGNMVWTDGENIYYSSSGTQYVLDKATSTWSNKTWSGLSSFDGSMVWSDGDDIFYSNHNVSQILNKSTSTWSNVGWNYNIVGVWSDGDDIYVRVYVTTGDIYYIYRKIDKSLGKCRIGSSSPEKVWTDGDNVYYSSGTTQQVLRKYSRTDIPDSKNIPSARP